MNGLKEKIGSKRWFGIAYALLATLPLLAALYLAFYYIYGPGEGYFHSDCTDTIYWANAALEGNGIFDYQYNYAALLPFSTVWIMQPLIKLFGFGMTAHNLGMAIFAVIFAGGVYFCARSARLSHLWSSTSVFAMFMILSCSDKLREMMWGHTIYYSLGLVLMFYLLGLGIRFYEAVEEGKMVKATVFGLLLLGLSIGSATDGMQIVVLTVLPVGAAFAADRIFATKDGLITKKTIPALASALVIAAGTLGGTVLLNVITDGGRIRSGYAAGYSGWSTVSSWLSNAQKFVNHYFSLLGVDMGKNAPIFNAESMKYFFRIAIGVILIAMPIVILCFYGRIRSRCVRLMVWAHFVLTAVVLFGYICGELSAANWRLMPIIGSAAMLTLCGLRDLTSDLGLFEIGEDTGVTVVLSRVSALFLAVVIASSLVFAKEVKALDPEYGRDNTNHRLAEFLVEEGLEYGYATFWYSQAITVLSNSEVRVRNMQIDDDDGVIGRHYQSDLDWYNDQEGVSEYFVILSSSEYRDVFMTDNWEKWMDECYLRHYDSPNDAKGFQIYVFSENILRDFGSDARAE